MAARSMASSTITFGLVSVPVRLYPATRESAGLSFHLLHEKDGVRLRQQLVCPKDGDVVPRNEAVKGYEYSKGEFVTFTDKELKALDKQASAGIEVTEFVPADSLPPVHFDRSYYLGPDKGGDRAFALLVAALEEEALLAIGQYAARGKDYLVALRPFEKRLLMQQLFHADEVRPVSEVPAPDSLAKAAELKLARELVGQLSSERFAPDRYEDEVRKRIRELIDQKVEGGQIRAAPEARPPAKVIDLMEALKASLAKRGEKERAEKVEKKAKGGKAERARPQERRRAPLRQAG
jgi:DNA end-binding protein Ku